MKAIKSNMYDHTGLYGPHPVMYCRDCLKEQSANAGDYWDTPSNHQFKCCGQTMEIVYRVMKYIPMTKKDLKRIKKSI